MGRICFHGNKREEYALQTCEIELCRFHSHSILHDGMHIHMRYCTLSNRGTKTSGVMLLKWSSFPSPAFTKRKKTYPSPLKFPLQQRFCWIPPRVRGSCNLTTTANDIQNKFCVWRKVDDVVITCEI